MSNRDPVDLARDFEAEFAAQMDRLNVRAPLFTLRVTQHIDDIVQFVEVRDGSFAVRVLTNSITPSSMGRLILSPLLSLNALFRL